MADKGLEDIEAGEYTRMRKRLACDCDNGASSQAAKRVKISKTEH